MILLHRDKKHHKKSSKVYRVNNNAGNYKDSTKGKRVRYIFIVTELGMVVYEIS